MTPHYLTAAFKLSLTGNNNTAIALPDLFFGFAMIVAGGALAFLWHPAALALCAWGVLIAVFQAHASLVRHIMALNDSLIALDAELQVDTNRIERAVRPLQHS